MVALHVLGGCAGQADLRRKAAEPYDQLGALGTGPGGAFDGARDRLEAAGEIVVDRSGKSHMIRFADRDRVSDSIDPQEAERAQREIDALEGRQAERPNPVPPAPSNSAPDTLASRDPESIDPSLPTTMRIRRLLEQTGTSLPAPTIARRLNLPRQLVLDVLGEMREGGTLTKTANFYGLAS